MKSGNRILAIAVMGLGMMSSGAFAAINAPDLTVSGDVHLATSNHIRGEQFSAGEPSIGFKLNAEHASGVFGSFSSDSVKLGDIKTGDLGKERNQLHNVTSVGFAKTLPQGIVAGVSLDYHAFTGQGSVSDLSFGELSAFANWNGAYAKLHRNIAGSNVNLAGYSFGDTIAELGYTYQLNQKLSVGGDVGYTMYGNKNANTQDGLTVAAVRAGYQVNEKVNVNLTYQLNLGENAWGEKVSGNNKAYLQAAYAF